MKGGIAVKANTAVVIWTDGGAEVVKGLVVGEPFAHVRQAGRSARLDLQHVRTETSTASESCTEGE